MLVPSWWMCRCWVVDRTGLGLFFCENPTSRRNRGKTRFSRRYSRQLSESTGQGYGRRRSREEPIGTEAATLVTILTHSLEVRPHNRIAWRPSINHKQ